MKSNINQEKRTNVPSYDDIITEDELIRRAKEANALHTVVDTETGEVKKAVEICFLNSTRKNFKPLKHTDFNLEFNDTIRYLLYLVHFEETLKPIDMSVLLYTSTQVDKDNIMTYTDVSIGEALNTSRQAIGRAIKRLKKYKFVEELKDKNIKKLRLLLLNCHFSYRGDKYSVQRSLSDSPHIIGFKGWAKENNCNLKSVVYRYGTTENTQININIANVNIDFLIKL